MKKTQPVFAFLFTFLFTTSFTNLYASEADLAIPDLHEGAFHIWGNSVSAWDFLFYGALIILGTLGFSLFLFNQIKKMPSHNSMLKVANTIYETCRTYLLQQGKFLLMLFGLVAIVLCVYFFGLAGESFSVVIQVLLFSIVGMSGSYAVAWYGIRVNTYANARTAFAALRGRPLDVVNIPLRAGMSVGLFLISLELVMMVFILLFVPREIVGICFLGFAIGESLGASALRIAGGIFTKIADIGSDLMKVVFKVKEDDPRNPGVIADCTGDNAGDSVGPTADGFETYGVTGVALISFITLAVTDPDMQAKLIVWIFGMRFLMDFLSGCSFFINQAISERLYGNKKSFDFEAPLMRLIWIAAILCISASFFMSYLLLDDIAVSGLWWKLAVIISCGTLAAVLIPEFTKIFTSSKSKHVQEIVTASREGGASLNILSGIVAGNFSAFWTGLLIVGLMGLAYFTAGLGLSEVLGPHASIFAFGLVAFGFLCMGPVTIAVDSYGPVTDNAQSVFELSQIEQIQGIEAEIEKDFGFNPDFETGKHYLEANDSAGNTFKATAKPVLIGTAVVGATTMIFSIILLLEKAGLLSLSLTDAPVLLGLICGGAVIFWFSGASMQAVTTGAYRAVEYIKRTFNMNKKEADIEDSKSVVKICTQYAQKGMWNIFLALISLTLSFAFMDPNFFVAYLVSIAVFGLFQAIYMANAGGSWDNAKKVVEVDLKERNTPLHEAAVIGDTVGDPFKDTSSVSLNPIIKFSTLFGLLATEICIEMKANPGHDYSAFIAIPFLLIGLYFVWRSFYKMRIPVK
ncbi:sodium-translocating pyrophosphatase [Massilibacteroides sp.]|uniref:sodium-translocating pyrophosphatase n=1 Tax=Massilibacteroides sp. TaxID=2034766 RepID=UPI002614F438|nr:sodium-translocating pyrophosphatase [Massilibacteroides sp.]MDD4516100.1 sodium-translocating pyrophosphatase [Massilibacteroides sp.]